MMNRKSIFGKVQIYVQNSFHMYLWLPIRMYVGSDLYDIIIISGVCLVYESREGSEIRKKNKSKMNRRKKSKNNMHDEKWQRDRD